jgi:hypothetical protein
MRGGVGCSHLRLGGCRLVLVPHFVLFLFCSFYSFCPSFIVRSSLSFSSSFLGQVMRQYELAGIVSGFILFSEHQRLAYLLRSLQLAFLFPPSHHQYTSFPISLPVVCVQARQTDGLPCIRGRKQRCVWDAFFLLPSARD